LYRYLYLDIWSRQNVGWIVHEEQRGAFALHLLHASCARLGRSAGERVRHSDHSRPMKGISMLAMTQTIGIVPSSSKPQVSRDNRYVAPIFRTHKYRPGEHRTRFDSVQSAANGVERFVRRYNHQHLRSGVGFITPADGQDGRDLAIVAQRRTHYDRALSVHPERWTRAHRPWKRPAEVLLLPNVQALTREAAGLRTA
jgi:putative transposase